MDRGDNQAMAAETGLPTIDEGILSVIGDDAGGVTVMHSLGGHHQRFTLSAVQALALADAILRHAGEGRPEFPMP